MKKVLFYLLITLIAIPNIVNAESLSYKISLSNGGNTYSIKDKKELTYQTISKDVEIKITTEKEFNKLYIQYYLEPSKGTIVSNGKTYNVGENNFLNEYLEVDNTTEITLTYNSKVKLAEIYVFDDNGDLPDFVEIWNPPCEKADIMLFSTHADDEQLFFLGILPTYVARGASVQVVYFANHNDKPKRIQEQLHGLYAVGIRNYPEFGIVPDAYSTSLQGALNNLKKANMTEEDTIKFQVEMIRKYKPQVVIGHDEKGEYGHGQHILNTHSLEQAILLTNDPTYDPDSAELYGTFDVPKMYLHLYEKNQIIMDYDTPLEYFDGLTAYQVSLIGFSKHVSQQTNTMFPKWVHGQNNEYTKSTDITKYSPNQFGLYRTLVGEDVEKNDFLENITTYKEQEEIALKQKEEEERLKKEQEEKAEAEAKENENTDNKTDETNKIVDSIINFAKENTLATIIIIMTILGIIGIILKK